MPDIDSTSVFPSILIGKVLLWADYRRYLRDVALRRSLQHNLRLLLPVQTGNQQRVDQINHQ